MSMHNDPQTSPPTDLTPTLSDVLRTGSTVERQQEYRPLRPAFRHAKRIPVRLLTLILPAAVMLWVAWHSLGS
jgi:hypothetical protein